MLDTPVRELTRGGQSVPLSPKAFRLLEVLAERRPHAIAQEELRRLVWPGAMAGGTTLARLINEIRAALGDDARAPQFVRTVHRFGYALSSLAREEEGPEPALAVGYALQRGTRQVPLAVGENIIGRAPGAAVNVASSKVSRRHARILVGERGVILEDLGSKNGTRLGDRRIDAPVRLAAGDRIVVGPVLLIFRACTGDTTTSTQAPPARGRCR